MENEYITIKGQVKIGLNCSHREFEFEMAANATEEEIEEAATEAALEYIDWYYEVEQK